MNGEIAMKAIGLHEFGGPEVLGIAAKEQPHSVSELEALTSS
jgi:hypothetical protein